MRNILLFLFLILIILKQPVFCQNTSLKTIYFDKNKFSIDVKYRPLLKKLAFICNSDSTSHVKIIAYSDKAGSEAYNNLLSKKRAYSVLNYMLAYAKFDTTKVYITWLGETNEVYDLHLKNPHFQKRCVDIWMQFNK
ncbi:MAG: OmpA family protein [Bacteroidota bacterium]